MLPFNMGVGGSSGVDTGDIGHSLRFRGAQYIATSLTTAATSTYFILFKQAKLGAISPLFDTNIKINANDTITAFGLTTTAVKRDPTGWHWMHVSNNGLVVDGVNLGAVTTSAITNPRIGYDGTNYANMYGARVCCVSGSSLAYTDFVYFNSEINEWVVKSKSAIKALVDAGGSAGFMYEFDDASSLTTLGNDYSSKNNDGTLTGGFSLTAGTTYDHMLDVPGNSFATLNSINKVAAHTMSNGNLYWAMAGGTGYMCRSTMAMGTGKWVAEVKITASTTQTSVGVVSSGIAATADPIVVSGAVMYYRSGTKYVNGVSSAYGASYTTGDRIRIELSMDGLSVEFFKNGVSQGSIALGTTGLAYCFAGADANFLPTQLDFCFGQAPLDASSAYRSDAGGYFVDTPTTGFKALCQRNLPDPAKTNPAQSVVAVSATEDNIYSTLAAARSSFSSYVDVLINRSAAESRAWQFSHDSSNEHSINGADTYQSKRAMSGANVWTGYSFNISAASGSAAGSVSHTNGADTTVTHSLGISARQMVLLFPRAGGATVYVYHPEVTAGQLLNLCSTAASSASSAIKSVLSSSFKIDTAMASGTYDYLVLTEMPGGLQLRKETGNGSTDGVYIDTDGKPLIHWSKAFNGADGWNDYNAIRDPYNEANHFTFLDYNHVEGTALGKADLVSRGVKMKATTYGNANTYIFASATWPAVAGKYSLGR